MKLIPKKEKGNFLLNRKASDKMHADREAGKKVTGQLPRLDLPKPVITMDPEFWNTQFNRAQAEKKEANRFMPGPTNMLTQLETQDARGPVKVDMYGNPVKPTKNIEGDYNTYDGGTKKEVVVKPENKAKPKGIVNQKVIEWQKKLKAEGFEVGAIDGKWGKKTEAAYQSYLKNKERLERVGLPQDDAPFIQPRQGFPTPQSAYLKKGGLVPKKEKGGKTKKLLPGTLSGDEIITDEVYKDMNPAFWKDHQNELAAKRLAPTKKQKPNTNLIPEKKDKPELTTDKYNKKAKGGLMKPKKKKCACGCAMKISKNAKGGLIESCACGCKTKK